MKRLATFLAALLGAIAPASAWAICASVRIEINQELTFERQAFEATMKIENGIPTSPLEKVQVAVLFTDDKGAPVRATSDPNDLTAAFFLRIDKLEGVGAVDGTGKVAAGGAAIIRWLIIPSPGASDNSSGKLFFVGADLSYRIDGKDESVTVAPDSITVKPMPRLILDYFLPRYVQGVDADAAVPTPPDPFSLAVRGKNDGYGLAKAVAIDTAQPRIVENKLGLLAAFEILRGYVDDKLESPSLLLKLGDIESKQARIGRWEMVSALSGAFKSFTATFRHADELGGQLTSLIDKVSTHRLVHDVLVDLPGRDAVRDLLAVDAEQYTVYESQMHETPVNYLGVLSLTKGAPTGGGGTEYTLKLPVTTGFFYAKIPDGDRGGMALQSGRSASGKLLGSANFWKSREGQPGSYQYFWNLFDTGTGLAGGSGTVTYTFVLAPDADRQQAPVVVAPDRRIAEVGKHLGTLVQSFHAAGPPELRMSGVLPSGATFTPNDAKGEGFLDFTPKTAGPYSFTFVARRAGLITARTLVVEALSSEQLAKLVSPDGKGGSTTFPSSLKAPGQPILSAPNWGAVVGSPAKLTVQNAKDGEGRPLRYEFQLSSDEGFSSIVASNLGVAQGTGTTSWEVPSKLAENGRYYWRARAKTEDGLVFTRYTHGSFVHSAIAEAPAIGALWYPRSGAIVGGPRPELSSLPAVDPERGGLSYRFEIFTDPEAKSLFAASGNRSAEPHADLGELVSWRSAVDLPAGEYYWRVTARDDSGRETRSDLAVFSVAASGDDPKAPVFTAPLRGASVLQDPLTLALSIGEPPAGTLFVIEVDTVAGFTSADRRAIAIGEGEIPEGTTYSSVDKRITWAISSTENTVYHARARAVREGRDSPWATLAFRTARRGFYLPMPSLGSPGPLAWIDSPNPFLWAYPPESVDGANFTLQFEIYDSPDKANPPVVSDLPPGQRWWQVSPALTNRKSYYVRARYLDPTREAPEGGSPLSGDWTPLSMFFVDDENPNRDSDFVFLQPARDLELPAETGNALLSWRNFNPDARGFKIKISSKALGGATANVIRDYAEEGQPGEWGSFQWNLRTVPPGVYEILAETIGHAGSRSVAAAGRVRVLRFPTFLSYCRARGTSASVASLDATIDSLLVLAKTTDCDLASTALAALSEMTLSDSLTDLRPIAGFSALRELDIRATAAIDLSPLVDLPLTKFSAPDFTRTAEECPDHAEMTNLPLRSYCHSAAAPTPTPSATLTATSTPISTPTPTNTPAPPGNVPPTPTVAPTSTTAPPLAQPAPPGEPPAPPEAPPAAPAGSGALKLTARGSLLQLKRPGGVLDAVVFTISGQGAAEARLEVARGCSFGVVENDRFSGTVPASQAAGSCWLSVRAATATTRSNAIHLMVRVVDRTAFFTHCTDTDASDAVKLTVAAITQALLPGGDCSQVDDLLMRATELRLIAAGLTELAPLEGLLNLKLLNLTGNQIVSLRALGTLRGLERLYLAGNKIDTLRPIRGLRGMRVMTLSGNPVPRTRRACPPSGWNEPLARACTRYLEGIEELP